MGNDESDLKSKDNTKTNITIFSKQVIENDLEEEVLTREIDKETVRGVIKTLCSIGKSNDYDEFELKDNCKIWINDILNNYPDNPNYENIAKFLINDFSSDMNTRMREANKYSILILQKNFLLICHAKTGEKTITPMYQVVDRMLDRDNVERFVIFSKKDDEKINVIYYEKTASLFFVKWLGIPERNAHYLYGGENRFYCNIDGVKIVFELADENIEEKLLGVNPLIKIENNILTFPEKITQLPINQIRSGKKHFTSIAAFEQDYFARKYELSLYKDEYTKIIKTIEPLLFKYIDKSDSLVKYESDSPKILIRKSNPNFHILFASKIGSIDTNIEIDPDYLDNLYSDFQNNVKIRIYHAGMDLYDQNNQPLAVGSFIFFNNIKTQDFINHLIKYVEERTILDDFIKKAFFYAIFKQLEFLNINEPLSYFFNKIVDKILHDLSKPNKVMQKENTLIEFKSSVYLKGNNDEIVDRIFEDLTKKFVESPFKLYLFGIEDKTKEVHPVISNQINEDRLGHIENSMENKFNSQVEITFLKIPLNSNNECLVLMLARKKE